MAAHLPLDLSGIDLRSVLHTLADGVSIATPEGRIIYSNPAADRILGRSASDRPPEDWASDYGVYVPNSDVPFPAEEYPLIRALAGEEVQEVEMLIRSPTRPGDVTISSSARPLRDEDGTITGAVVVFRDITRLRKAQRDLERVNFELLESQRLKEELSAFIVHDLKNPLTQISTLAELLLDEGDLDERVRSDLKDIHEATCRMHRMTMNLLDVQLAEDGSLQPDVEDVPVAAMLEEVRRSVRARARGLELGPIDPSLTVRADPDLLLRVLVNLVDNCIKYGPRDGRVSLQASRRGPYHARLSVQDEGPGVPPDLRERIFEKYAQVERHREGRSKGSRGLGLRFCKVVLDALEGRIWVEDAEPRGACFCVELPIGDS